MRVMFAVSSWPGHYYPMVPLGWALQAAGHDVRVVCAPSQTDAITRTGLTPVPVLDGMDMVFLTRLRYLWDAQAGNWPYPFMPLHPLTGEEVTDLREFDFDRYMSENTATTFGAMVRSFDAAVKFAKAWQPDLVVHDPLAVEGALAAAALKVPAITHLWGTAGSHEPASSGLAIVPDYPVGTFAKWKVGALGPAAITHVIDPCPEQLAPPIGEATRLPARFVPYNGSGIAPAWVDQPSEKPRVCVVWGTSTSAMSGPKSFLLPAIVEAVAGLDVEVVVTATAEDLATLGDLPDGVRAAERCPLHVLLPTCAAVVHHGGAGCAMTALDAGVPQLALSFAIEQALNGERIANTGAGAHLPGHLATVDSIRAAVSDLLEKPSYAAAAADLRDSAHARPAPADLVAALVRLASGEALDDAVALAGGGS
jgi:UDP:flavonoid glycosyltransferase YjiC (YdhE family)